MKYIIILTIFISCTPPVDYFGNLVDFKKEIIYLTKFREDSSVKDKYYLTFRQVYEIQKDEIKLREKTLQRYLNLIMGYYGYSEKKIIFKKDKNFIKPLYHVIVQFN